MDEKKEVFTYDYAAKQQKEVREIRQRYEETSPEVSKMDELKKLDESVQKAGLAPSLILGIISTLIMGVGMCCTLVWQGIWFVPGIVIGVMGIIGVALAYPLNSHVVKKRKEQLAPQILKLTDELMK